MASGKGPPYIYQTTAQLHSSYMLAKKGSKFSKPGFSSTWTVNFLMFKLVLEKAEEPEIKLPTCVGSSKMQESSRKTSNFALLTTPKSLTVWMTTNCGNSLRDGTIRPPYLTPKKSVCRSRSNSQNRTWNNRLVQYIKAVYCYPAYLTYMQSTSWEMLGWSTSWN